MIIIIESSAIMSFNDVEVRITIAKTEDMRGRKGTKLLVNGST